MSNRIKDRREVDRTLSIFYLDEKWQKLRDRILAGQTPYEAGLRGFQLALEAEIGALGDFPVRTERDEQLTPPLQEGSPVVIDLGCDDDNDGLFTDSSPTEPKLLARVDLRRIARIVDEATQQEKHLKDPVKDWQEQMEKFYESYGFSVEVPRPEITREELANWRADGWELLFRPSAKVVSYEQLMRAFGQTEHWTLRFEEASKIGWEPAENGYWFLTEAREITPRTGKAYNDYIQEIPEGYRLLCLEEYVILWHVMKDTLGAILDIDGYTLLRTHFGFSEVLFVRSNIDKTTIELIVRSWSQKISFRKMGTRYCRVIANAF